MSHTEERCPHGYPTTLRPAHGYPDGWVWPVADDCELCDGAPAALAFRPGPPQDPDDRRKP